MKTQKPTPAIGMPATYSIGSDRYPYTVTAVSASGKTFYITSDRHHGSGVFTLDPNGKTKRIYLAKDGSWKVSGGRGSGFVYLGEREFSWAREF